MNILRLSCLVLVLFSGSLAAQSIALISDLNGRYGNTTYDKRVGRAVDTIIAMQPDMVISAGDMVAGQKQPLLDHDRLDQMWNGFNLIVTDPLKRAGIPFLVTPGNHDGSGYQEYALERERFEAQWALRVPELEILPGSEWPRRYAARMGELLLLAFDGTRPGKLSKTERLFLERMLSTHAATASMTLVFSHLPMWPLAQGRETEIIDDPVLLSMLHEHGVNIYISGHHHIFFAGTDSAGMVHLGIGALGGNARTMVGQQERQPFSFALLELSDNQINIRSMASPGFTSNVPVNLQPRSVNGRLGTLHRLEEPVALRK